MAWKIEFDEKAVYDLEKLGKSEQKKILTYLTDRIANLADPRTSGKPLTGASYRGIWRYRVENYRILCKIENAKLTVLVVAVGHRNKIYD